MKFTFHDENIGGTKVALETEAEMSRLSYFLRYEDQGLSLGFSNITLHFPIYDCAVPFGLVGIGDSG